MRLSEILNENLGTLAQLNLGPLIGLLKTEFNPGSKRNPASMTGLATSFVDYPGHRITNTSEIIDIGPLSKGMTSLRKAFKQYNPDNMFDPYPKGFVLYVRNKAIIFAIIVGDKIRKQNPEVRVAYDLRDLEEYLTSYEEADREANKDKWMHRNLKIPRSSEQTLSRTEYPTTGNWAERRAGRIEILTPIVGKFMSAGELAYLVNQAADVTKEMGEPLTAKIIMSDIKALKKIQSRQHIRYELENTGDDLKTRLIKYKNTKKPTANSIQEFIDMVMKGQAKVINFNGRPWKTTIEKDYSPKDYHQKENLFKGIPFDIHYRSATPDSFDSLYITFMYDIMTGRLVPIEAQYDREKVILDDELWLRVRVGAGAMVKQMVIPKILNYIKTENFKEAKLIIGALRGTGVDWPELDTIEKSINIELAKKK